MSLHWSQVPTLYRWELRSALRDRTIVVNSIVLPLVLYPLILWATFSGIAFVRGQTDDLASRVAFIGPTAEAGDLAARFREDTRFQVVGTEQREGDAEERIRLQALDAGILLEPVPGVLAGNVRVRVIYDGSRERSDLARRRISDVVRGYRESRLREEASTRGIPPGTWAGFAIDQHNTASSRQMGSFVLGLMLPLFFVVMVALGCLTPAIDTTAGERERHTWETLMSTAASRGSIVVAKYLAVTTLGGVAGLLNMLAMLVTMRGVVAPLTGRGEDVLEFGLSLGAVPVLILGAVLLAGLLAAGMMVLAAFARTFREGQSMVTPFYLAAILPVMFLSTPGTQLTLPLALVPVINVALVVREAISGVLKLREISVAVIATIVAIALLLRLAAGILAVENIVIGSYSGSLASFLRRRLATRQARPTAQ